MSLAIDRARRIVARLVGGAGGQGRLDYDPRDRESSERAARHLLATTRLDAPGTESRGRQLLDIIGDSFPLPALTEAYFDNLALLLRDRPTLDGTGRLLIGLGAGRTGSTTLAHMLARATQGVSTHENPPLISWRPLPEQVDFHLRRFSMLLRRFDFVADVAHWWLNCLDALESRFPEVRFIGLVREEEACALSFARVKHRRGGGYNHWAPYGNGLWSSAEWDPAYPVYPVPADAARDPDGARLAMIRRYVADYNAAMARAAKERGSERFLVARTESLDSPDERRRILAFAGASGELDDSSVRLNVRSMQDGNSPAFHF